MAQDAHVILNHVDSPVKIFVWTKGELMLFCVPFVLGLLFEAFGVGVLVSILNAYLVSRYKRTFGKGQLQAVLYWFLPPTAKHRGLPPSFVRDYLG
jgi:type IV conjugative transfer system protein TraL